MARTIPKKQSSDFNMLHFVGIVLLALFIVVVIKGCEGCFKDPYTDAEYNAWIRPIDSFIKNEVSSNSSVKWSGSPGSSIILTIDFPVTKRQAAGLALKYANGYMSRFPKTSMVFVHVKDYDSMTTIYHDAFSRK